ncbi:MAG: polyprenyl synthetase family protein [Thermodesulfobacteriota bacterium]
MNLKVYLQEKRDIVEQALQDVMLTPQGLLTKHIEAMSYSLFAGGKRVRPILCIAAAESLGADLTGLLPIAASLEFIHTYSLIHDDLPAMDNDELRRGKPTNHTVYGEAEAILAGDGLLTMAFEILSDPKLSNQLGAEKQLRLIHILSTSAGPQGMVGGQAIDIDSEGKEIPFATLRYLHSCKTGALITAAVEMGAVLGNADEDQFQAFSEYGKNIGLAFQIVDDLLNVEGTTEQLGKKAGSDAELEKATYPAFFGLDDTKKKAKAAVANAIKALQPFDSKADPLREIAHYIYYRKR